MDEPVVAPVVEPVTPIAEPAVEPVVATVAEPAVETVYFNGDGTLAKGWQSTLPEGYRDEKSLATVTDAKVLAKMFVDTKRMVGKDTVAILTDVSTQGEIEAFHIAGGRPETVADYNLKAPEGFPEEALEQIFPKARLEAWQERFFKGGVSKSAADHFIAEFANDMITDLQAMNQSKESEMAELKSGLATEWGAAFEQKKHLGNIAMNEAATSMVDGKEVVNEEFKARLVEKAGNDPDIIRAFANLGEKFAEGKPPGFAAIPTPNDYQDQIDTLMKDPLYLKGSQKERMKIAEKIMTIRKLMKPEPAVT